MGWLKKCGKSIEKTFSKITGHKKQHNIDKENQRKAEHYGNLNWQEKNKNLHFDFTEVINQTSVLRKNSEAHLDQLMNEQNAKLDFGNLEASVQEIEDTITNTAHLYYLAHNQSQDITTKLSGITADNYYRNSYHMVGKTRTSCWGFNGEPIHNWQGKKIFDDNTYNIDQEQKQDIEKELEHVQEKIKDKETRVKEFLQKSILEINLMRLETQKLIREELIAMNNDKLSVAEQIKQAQTKIAEQNQQTKKYQQEVQDYTVKNDQLLAKMQDTEVRIAQLEIQNKDFERLQATNKKLAAELVTIENQTKILDGLNAEKIKAISDYQQATLARFKQIGSEEASLQYCAVFMRKKFLQTQELTMQTQIELVFITKLEKLFASRTLDDETLLFQAISIGDHDLIDNILTKRHQSIAHSTTFDNKSLLEHAALQEDKYALEKIIESNSANQLATGLATILKNNDLDALLAYNETNLKCLEQNPALTDKFLQMQSHLIQNAIISGDQLLLRQIAEYYPDIFSSPDRGEAPLIFTSLSADPARHNPFYAIDQQFKISAFEMALTGVLRNYPDVDKSLKFFLDAPFENLIINFNINKEIEHLITKVSNASEYCQEHYFKLIHYACNYLMPKAISGKLFLHALEQGSPQSIHILMQNQHAIKNLAMIYEEDPTTEAKCILNFITKYQQAVNLDEATKDTIPVPQDTNIEENNYDIAEENQVNLLG